MGGGERVFKASATDPAPASEVAPPIAGEVGAEKDVVAATFDDVADVVASAGEDGADAEVVGGKGRVAATTLAGVREGDGGVLEGAALFHDGFGSENIKGSKAAFLPSCRTVSGMSHIPSL